VAFPLTQEPAGAGRRLRPRSGLPYLVVGEWGFPHSLLAPAGPLRPGPEELGELLGQLRVLAGLPKPVRALASVPLAPPPDGPDAVGPGSRQQDPGSGGPAGVRFRRQVERVAGFSGLHGRLPSIGRGTGAEERRLGLWLYRQRRRVQAGTATGQEAVLLAGALGGDWAEALGPAPRRRPSPRAVRSGDRQDAHRGGGPAWLDMAAATR
jgi:hypothetical protein